MLGPAWCTGTLWPPIGTPFQLERHARAWLYRHPSRRLALSFLLRSPFSQLVLALALVFPACGTAQSVVDRSPNLSGGWVGDPGTVYFNFLHRFEHGAAPARKVTNFPTFLLGYAPVERVLIGAQYATNSDLVASLPNEWEVFGRWAAPEMGPAELALTGGWNNSSESVDGEAALRLRAGMLSLLGAARAFSQGFGGDARFAVGGGGVLRLGSNLALAADVMSLLDRTDDERVAWSAGVQLNIPYTPHSLSVHASNTNTATLEGSSRGGPKTRYGFEFTVPFMLSRYFGSGSAPTEGPAVASAADTVVVAIRDFGFTPAQITIRPGATVVWVNEGRVAHTATADDGSWDSGVIEPGARWSRTFSEGPPQPYHCTPHPFMKGTVRISGEER